MELHDDLGSAMIVADAPFTSEEYDPLNAPKRNASLISYCDLPFWSFISTQLENL